jgi:hypothetical protein
VKTKLLRPGVRLAPSGRHQFQGVGSQQFFTKLRVEITFFRQLIQTDDSIRGVGIVFVRGTPEEKCDSRKAKRTQQQKFQIFVGIENSFSLKVVAIGVARNVVLASY